MNAALLSIQKSILNINKELYVISQLPSEALYNKRGTVDPLAVMMCRPEDELKVATKSLQTELHLLNELEAVVDKTKQSLDAALIAKKELTRLNSGLLSMWRDERVIALTTSLSSPTGALEENVLTDNLTLLHESKTQSQTQTTLIDNERRAEMSTVVAKWEKLPAYQNNEILWQIRTQLEDLSTVDGLVFTRLFLTFRESITVGGFALPRLPPFDIGTHPMVTLQYVNKLVDLREKIQHSIDNTEDLARYGVEIKTDLERQRSEYAIAREAVTLSVSRWYETLQSDPDQSIQPVDFALRQDEAVQLASVLPIAQVRVDFLNPSSPRSFFDYLRAAVGYYNDRNTRLQATVARMDQEEKLLTATQSGILAKLQQNEMSIKSYADTVLVSASVETRHDVEIFKAVIALSRSDPEYFNRSGMNNTWEGSLTALLRGYENDKEILVGQLRKAGLDEMVSCVEKGDCFVDSHVTKIGDAVQGKRAEHATEQVIAWIEDPAGQALQVAQKYGILASPMPQANATAALSAMEDLSTNVLTGFGQFMDEMEINVDALRQKEQEGVKEGSLCPSDTQWMFLYSLGCAGNKNSTRCDATSPHQTDEGGWDRSGKINVGSLAWELSRSGLLQDPGYWRRNQYDQVISLTKKLLADRTASQIIYDPRASAAFNSDVMKTLVLGSAGSVPRYWHDRYQNRRNWSVDLWQKLQRYHAELTTNPAEFLSGYNFDLQQSAAMRDMAVNVFGLQDASYPYNKVLGGISTTVTTLAKGDIASLPDALWADLKVNGIAVAQALL